MVRGLPPAGAGPAPEWFHPDPAALAADPGGFLADYDRLPEYPPLRYLALPALEYVGCLEETVRDIYDKVVDEEQSRWLSAHPLALFRLERRYYRTQNLEVLRLPVTRDLVDRLLESKLQRHAVEAIEARKSSMLNETVLALTLVAVVIALIQLAIAFSGS